MTQPLADKIRPKKIEELVGQEHLLGQTGVITRILKSEKIPSVILWGPAGCGKTTIAKILAEKSGLHFKMISATSSGASDLKKLFQEAEDYKKYGEAMVLLVDEIHCFRKNQQDLFLPYIENGTITLIGATTENPSFELNTALLITKPLDNTGDNWVLSATGSMTRPFTSALQSYVPISDITLYILI